MSLSLSNSAIVAFPLDTSLSNVWPQELFSAKKSIFEMNSTKVKILMGVLHQRHFYLELSLVQLCQSFVNKGVFTYFFVIVEYFWKQISFKLYWFEIEKNCLLFCKPAYLIPKNLKKKYFKYIVAIFFKYSRNLQTLHLLPFVKDRFIIPRILIHKLHKI